MGEAMRKDVQSYIGTVLLEQNNYFGTTHILVHRMHQHDYFSVVQVNYPCLLIEALPCSIGIASMVCLLHSCHDNGNMLLVVFGHLEMAVKISVWFVL